MKQHSSIIIFLILTLFQVQVFAQKETYDLVTYTAPVKWKKDTKENLVVFSIVDEAKGTWCQLSIVKSTISKGAIESDFESEWKQLADDPYTSGKPAQVLPVQEEEGWKTKSGVGKFIFNKADALVMVTTVSGYERCISFVATTNTDQYMDEVQTFLESVKMIKPSLSNNAESNTLKDTKPASDAMKSGYAFNTTNFDDGWTSVVKEDWAEVKKGNIKVLLHYPNKKADAYNSVLKESDYTAWNTLVAPRYSNMKNFEWKTIQSWQSVSFIEADAMENASGKTVHIVLFKKHYSNGNGRYLEFVTDSKAAYESEFGPYHNTEFDWDKVANMQFRNKFAVASSDLIGKWSTTDYASVSYYYINTGGLAGTTATSTADEFTFMDGNNYQSQHSGASGMVGNMKFSNQIYKGKSTVTNWNLVLTNRFEGATEKYDCRFEAIKDGRVLLMTDRLGTTHSLVKSK